MDDVEEELWNIFTFYTLRGGRSDLTSLSVTQFLRLARDCQIVDDCQIVNEGQRCVAMDRGLHGRSPGSAARRPKRFVKRSLGQATVNLAFASVVQRRTKVTPETGCDRKIKRQPRHRTTPHERATLTSKLNYPEFLDALLVLGKRMYSGKVPKVSKLSAQKTAAAGSRHCGRSVESTFQQLLMENILPLASRRRPVSVSAAMRDPLVRDLLRHYKPALREMFRFYAASPSAVVTKYPSRRGSSGSVGDVTTTQPAKVGDINQFFQPPAEEYLRALNITPPAQPSARPLAQPSNADDTSPGPESSLGTDNNAPSIPAEEKVCEPDGSGEACTFDSAVHGAVDPFTAAPPPAAAAAIEAAATGEADTFDGDAADPVTATTPPTTPPASAAAAAAASAAAALAHSILPPTSSPSPSPTASPLPASSGGEDGECRKTPPPGSASSGGDGEDRKIPPAVSTSPRDGGGEEPRKTPPAPELSGVDSEDRKIPPAVASAVASAAASAVASAPAIAAASATGSASALLEGGDDEERNSPAPSPWLGSGVEEDRKILPVSEMSGGADSDFRNPPPSTLPGGGGEGQNTPPASGLSGGDTGDSTGDSRSDITGGGSGGGGSGRVRSPASARSSLLSARSSAAVNSMAEALSHRSLLCFAADLGVLGALLSALEVGEVFLSCNGAPEEAPRAPNAGADAAKTAKTGGPSHGDFARTCLARAGKGGVRPLAFAEFLEALVRISLLCFRPRNDGGVLEAEEGHGDSIGPGHCLRALLTYMWRRVHASAELALNGVREGGARHRSSIQKGALMKGVQLFNKRMLSRWRTEGFLDFATTDAASAAAAAGTLPVTAGSTPREGQAVEILRKLLARSEEYPAGPEVVVVAGSIEVSEISLDRRLVEDVGRGGGGGGGGDGGESAQGNLGVQQTAAVPWTMPDPLTV